MNTFYKLIQGDCIKKLPELESNSIDLIVTDPPYHIEQEGKVTKQKGKIISTAKAWGHWTDDSFSDYDLMIKAFIDESKRLLKEGGSCYLWLDRAKIGLYWKYIEDIGLTPKNALIWIKTQPMPHFRKNNYRSSYEQCIWYSKGTPNVFNFLKQSKMKNVFYANNTIRTTKHPTEKPLDLIKWHIEVSSNRGDVVLDPFMGSGTTMMASQELGRSCIGIELNPDYIDIINQRCYGRQFLDRSVDYDFVHKRRVKQE